MPNYDAAPGKLDRCQITGSTNLFEAIDRGHQPPCDALLSEAQIYEPETHYPLRLMICPDSGLAEVDYVVAGETIYSADSPYRAGISKPLQDYQRAFADDIVERFGIAPDSLCVDMAMSRIVLKVGGRTAPFG